MPMRDAQSLADPNSQRLDCCRVLLPLVEYSFCFSADQKRASVPAPDDHTTNYRPPRNHTRRVHGRFGQLGDRSFQFRSWTNILTSTTSTSHPRPSVCPHDLCIKGDWERCHRKFQPKLEFVMKISFVRNTTSNR
jgi:hypothetical protein